MTQRFFTSQRDFSFGQVNADYKRRDDTEAVRTGGAVMSNFRILATGQLVPRPGRRVLFPPPGQRVDPIRMGDGSQWRVAFNTNQVSILRRDGSVANSSLSPAYPWTTETLSQIVFTIAANDVIVCFPGMQPQILRWTPSTGDWDIVPFAFTSSANQVQEPFYRLSILGATMRPGGLSGSVTLTCSAPYFTAAMAGTRLSLVGQQVLITAVVDPLSAVGYVAYRLPQSIGIPVADTSIFQPGQVAETSGENIKIEVSSISAPSGAGFVNGTLLSTLTAQSTWNGMQGTVADTITSPLGTTTVTGAPVGIDPQPSLQWQEEFMSNIAGWPASCFYDRGRLGFCDFPQMPGAVLYSAINGTSSFWVDSVAAGLQPAAGAAADAAIFEILPGSRRIKYVVPFHGDQFAFTDQGIFYIPVQASGNPLKPGSVEFRQIANDGCADIVPINTQDTIVYLNAGRTRCSVVRATGSYTLPYTSEDISDPHTDLFRSPVALAITTGDGQASERYVYALNVDGTLAVGKFTPERKFIGWVPWTSTYPVLWVSTDGAYVYYTTAYPGGPVCEYEDETLFLDGTIALGNLPSAMALSGSGTFWYLASTTVTVMDINLDRGDRAVDAAGSVGWDRGEDTSSPTLVVGVSYPSPTFVPFARGAPDGQAVMQRQRRRRVTRAVATIRNSSGFTFGSRTYPAVNFGEDATAQPVLRETTETVRPLGRAFDPVPPAVIKDRPGPFTLCEYGLEETV